jgi:hypothetical protein
VRHEDAVLEQFRQPRQHVRDPGRGVHHRLGDPGEALDAAREGLLGADKRLEGAVQLPTSHEHRPHLGQLAHVARAAVGLDVDREVFGACDLCALEVHPATLARGSDAAQRRLQRLALRSGA